MHTFDPVSYSLEENRFIIEHAGKPWVVAAQHIRPVRLPDAHPKDKHPIYYPDGVNPNAVKPMLDRIYELMEMETHTGQTWVGVGAIKEAAQVYLAAQAQWQADKKRGAPRFPSMHSFDSKGRPHRQGPSSDSGRVSTYFAPDGSRKPFKVDLIPTDPGGWVADWAVNASVADRPTDGILHDEANRRFECLICRHTEQYKAESRTSQNMARSRLSKHLRKPSGDARTDELHREAHTNNFGAST